MSAPIFRQEDPIPGARERFLADLRQSAETLGCRLVLLPARGPGDSPLELTPAGARELP
jgi:hypothetical protein